MMKKALLVALCLVCLLLTGCGKNETAAVPTDALPAKAVAENAIVAAAAITIGFNNFFIFIQILSQDIIFFISHKRLQIVKREGEEKSSKKREKIFQNPSPQCRKRHRKSGAGVFVCNFQFNKFIYQKRKSRFPFSISTRFFRTIS